MPKVLDGVELTALCRPGRQSFLCLLAFIYRNCTEDGWTELSPSYEEACEFTEDEEEERETTYFSNFRQVYTAGYATSLISLITAIFKILLPCRKFHCTRNYIHINLFFSFILRASAVFIKDGILFSDEDLDHCFMSTVKRCSSIIASTFTSAHNLRLWEKQ
uniref:Growth hormone releasing hormone receptor b n=1 Tax=Mastacembelus armatus TaxID=205130 RepID=A0A7N8Y7G5_9TELE